MDEIINEIIIEYLNLNAKSQPNEFELFLQKISEFSKNNSFPELKKIQDTVKKVLEEKISVSDALRFIGEEISSLQKLIQEKKISFQKEDKMEALSIDPQQEIELYRDFIQESREHLNAIESNVVKLEQNLKDKEVINHIFRSFHTIKGVSGFLGLDLINKLSHSVENMLDLARNENIEFESESIDLILEAVDLLRSMIDSTEKQIEGKKEKENFPVSELINKIDFFCNSLPSQQLEENRINFEEDLSLYQEFITEAKEHLNEVELNILSLEQNPEDKEIINRIFRPFHTIKGISGFLALDLINKLSHEIENMLELARNGKISINEDAINVILEVVDLLKEMIEDIENQVSSKKATGKKFSIQKVIEKIKSISEPAPPKKIGEILVEEKVVSEETVAKALKKQKESGDKIGEILIKDYNVSAKEVTEALRKQKSARSTFAIKVDTKKLDNLIDMIGELLITQSMIRQNPILENIKDQKLMRDLSQLGRITTELQKISMSLRMVPIKETFQKMIRLVRDLSKRSGKKVQLIMNGEDTEIDRNMVEELYDPLVHMIRNAVDHGIEAPQERKKKGKAEIGTIKLSAYHKGGNIVIEIKDDGKGLDKEKILKRAIQKGLISEKQTLTDFEIYQLIFSPGFSTAEKITDISGRGVGMDVVKKTIEKLGGKIDINTEIEKGTNFILKLPLTLAIIDGIIVKIGEHRYILPTVAVQEILRPTKEQYTTYAQKGEMINIRNQLYPLVRLYSLFNIKPKYTNPWNALVIIVENEGEKKSFMVDEVLGKQEVVIKSLGEGIGKFKGFAGGAIMGDGRVGLILDIAGIFEINKKEGRMSHET